MSSKTTFKQRIVCALITGGCWCWEACLERPHVVLFLHLKSDLYFRHLSGILTVDPIIHAYLSWFKCLQIIKYTTFLVPHVRCFLIFQDRLSHGETNDFVGSICLHRSQLPVVLGANWEPGQGNDPLSSHGPWVVNRFGTVGIKMLPRFCLRLSAAIRVPTGKSTLFLGLRCKRWILFDMIPPFDGILGSYVFSQAIFFDFFLLGLWRSSTRLTFDSCSESLAE